MVITAKTRKRISLEVLRDGKSLLPSSLDGGGNSVELAVGGADHSSEAIIGRLDILPAHHKSCGCSSDRNSAGSTKGKCDACSAVNQWATTHLSRRLLRFSCDEKEGRLYVQARGRYASVKLGSKLLTSTDAGDDWGEKSLVKPGDVLSLAPTQVKGTTLELSVLVDEEDTETVNSPVENPTLSTDASNPESGKEERQIEEDAEAGMEMPSPNQDREASTTSLSDASNIVEATMGPFHSGEQLKRKPETVEQKKEQPSVFLVPLGQDLSSLRRKFLASKAEKLGMTVVQNVFDATHVVISQQVSTLDEVSQALNIPEKCLRSYIEQNDIPCVLPQWIAAAQGEAIVQPGLLERWYGDISKKPRGESRKVNGNHKHVSFPRNNELAEVFRELSNLHQSCPLLEMDQWKAYMFRIIAGRLTYLDFEITNDPDSLSRLRRISGIGSNSVDKIQEYLETGRIARFEEFNSDPQRVSMRNMMRIWGVGRKTALDLIFKGFRNISDVRLAIREGRHFLDRNQLVGVDCYEDILEEMTREEVKKIGSIVEEIVHELFPDAQVRIMGSYRRQKPSCGDIDIHITHPSFVKKNPPQCLSKIVDLLWEREWLVYHLTFLAGMQTGSSVADYMKSSRHIPGEAWECSKPVGYLANKGHSGSSYMGVIKSPVVAGKRRRIDIKFYPWRERIFAALYFTGNGYFNRSMRLWASRKFRYTLNDRGLYYAGTQDRVMEASEESEVFEKLNLVYKEPHERDSFDAVVSKEGPVDIACSQSEFQEDKNYTWVN